MAKIAILSFPRYYNYGTFLQLYALQHIVQRYGHQPELIDYDPYNDSGQQTPVARRMLQRLISPLERLLRLRHGQAGDSFTVNRAQQRARFEDFLHHDLRLGPTTYYSPQQLQEDPPLADVFVVGSDQVWNPLSHFQDPAYFLHFAAPHKRIAYAPSFGVAELPEITRPWYQQQLSTIPHLSVREQEGAAIVKSLTGQTVSVVLDPVFLLGAMGWHRFAGRSKKRQRPYLLAYFLESDPYMREVALEMAAERNLEPLLIPVHPIDQQGLGRQFQQLSAVGPREFVSLIARAACVCTDSFHGTAFATILNRPFLTFKRYANPQQAANHSRLESLLRILDLTDRITDADRRGTPAAHNVDFTAANQTMSRLRFSSLQYLHGAIATAASNTPASHAVG